MLRKTLLIISTALLSYCSGAQDSRTTRTIPNCEDCEFMLEGMPASLSWRYTITTEQEPGEPLIVRGTIFKNDGKTPAPGVVLYIYHTDKDGLYSPAKNQVDGKRHGHLRGWIKTDATGRYEFKTIRPASYPNSNNPQHIHPIIMDGNHIYWIDEYLFSDDPLLSEKEKQHQPGRGGSGIVTPLKSDKGTWVVQRDIILGLNVPSYKP